MCRQRHQRLSSMNTTTRTSIQSSVCSVVVVTMIMLSSLVNVACDIEVQPSGQVDAPSSGLLVAVNVSTANVTFEPSANNRLVLFDDGEPKNLTVIIRRRFDVIGPLVIQLNLVPTSKKPQTVIGVRGMPPNMSEDSAECSESAIINDVVQIRCSVELTGYWLGRSVVRVTAWEANNNQSSSFQISGSAPYSVLVNRPPASTMSTAFLFTLMSGVILNMLSFAVRLHKEFIRYHILHPAPTLIGIGCQFVILPALAYVLGLIFDLPANVRYALLVLGCCAGGGPSNFITIFLLGDIHMSVMMTTVSNLVSIGLIPVWLITLGEILLRADFPTFKMSVPWRAVALLGLAFSVPAVLGAVFRRLVSDKVSLITSLVLRLFGVMCVVAGAIGSIYSNVFIVDYAFKDWKLVVATILLCDLSFFISYAISRIGRRSHQASLTIGVEAAIQAYPASLLIIQLTCPQPESTIGAYSVIMITVFNVFLMIFIGVVAVHGPTLVRMKTDESPVVKVGFDTTASITDLYALSNVDVADTTKSEFEMSKTSDGGLGSRSASFVKLPDMY